VATQDADACYEINVEERIKMNEVSKGMNKCYWDKTGDTWRSEVQATNCRNMERM